MKDKLVNFKNKLSLKIEKLKHDKVFMYTLCVSVLILFCLALNIAFSSFTHTASNIAANIKVKNMTYSMTINGVAGTMVTATANDITKANVGVVSLNSNDSKYELIYHVCSDQACETYIDKPDGLTVEYSSRTTDPISGIITASGNKSLRVVVTNTTSTTYYIKLDMNAGYSYNTLALLNMFTEYNEDDVTIAAYIDGTLSTTFPTTNNYNGTVTCKVNGSAANATGTASWNGTKWVVNITGADTGETRCNAYFVTKIDTSGANSPVLATNMIPVYYDETNDLWKKADSTNSNTTYKWYDYTSQIWANAVTVTSGTRSTYNTASVGTTVNMDDILGFWVWIPRYEYKITNSGTTLTAEQINVNFISGTSTTNTSGYLIHSAFRNGTVYKNAADYDLGGWDSEQSGIWYGKFETGYATNFTAIHSAETSNILIKPDTYSMRYQTVSNEYTTAQNIRTDHGLPTTVDTHMSKNDEWGAVAYLSLSAYGKQGSSSYTGSDKEVYVNNAYYGTGGYFYTTGRSAGTYAGGTNSASSQYGTYEYNNCPASSYSKTACTLTVRQTNANKGTGASTTGNVYGVYDMSGGASEYVMGNYAGTIFSSGFSSMPTEQKYWNKYTSTTLSTACNGTTCKGVGWSNETGNGQVSGQYNWYSDYIYLPDSSYPWVIRGDLAYLSSSSFAGPLYSYYYNGNAVAGDGFRAVLSAEG